MHSFLRSPRSELEQQHILRPLTDNATLLAESCSNMAAGAAGESGLSEEDVSGLLVDTLPVPEILSPGGMLKKDHNLMSPRSVCSGSNGGGGSSSGHHQQQKFHAKFTRRYVELDDELISVATDVEDDEDGPQAAGLGYHTVLALEVHGAGYQPMAMVSNSKAAKLTGRCAKVTQRTFDLDLFCHHMAQRLCAAAGKKYWFCNDYDVEIVDVDPESGDVVFVAVVLVTATVFTKKVVSQRDRYAISSLHRLQYQAGFKFCWNLDTAKAFVIDSEPLAEKTGRDGAGGMAQSWHPARASAAALRRAWNGNNVGVNSGSGGVKCLSNDAVIRGASLKTIVDSDHLIAIIQDDIA